MTVLSLDAFVPRRAATCEDRFDLVRRVRADMRRGRYEPCGRPAIVNTACDCWFYGAIRVVAQYDIGLSERGEGTALRADVIVKRKRLARA